MIHYHGMPLGGEERHYLAIQGKHTMVSFARPEYLATIAELSSSFCLDNGAFSAWKSGKRIDWDEYYEWAWGWLRHPGCDFAVIPDVIDGTAADNDRLIADWPGELHQWAPVWHLHEGLGRLVRLCGEFPRVCLGSSGEFATVGDRKWWNRMAEALDAVTDDDGFPITKLHGLRMLDPGLFSYIPFASADSTNVARNTGIDVRWTGPYVPRSQKMRALVIMDRIENHACAARWHKGFQIKQANFDLIG